MILSLDVAIHTKEHKAGYFEVAVKQQHSSTGSLETICSKLALLTLGKARKTNQFLRLMYRLDLRFIVVLGGAIADWESV